MLTLQGENPTSGPVIVLSCIWSEWHHHSNHPRSLPPEVQKTHPRIGKPHNGAPFFSSHQFSERGLERWKLWKPLATGEWKSLSRRVQPDVPVLWKPRSTISARNILIFAAPGAEACGALRTIAALCGQLRRTKFVCGRLRNACGSSVGKGTTRLVKGISR